MQGFSKLVPRECTEAQAHKERNGVVSKETVTLRWWGSSTQKVGFINGVDNVN